MKPTRVIQTDDLPEPHGFGPGAVLLHDRRLPRIVPGFREWAGAFPARYGVTAGEGLKAVEAFPAHITRLLDRIGGSGRREAKLVCAGGGSVGDFGGFAASVLRRGIGLVQMPSTWLAAIDSAHGGKTALNAGGAKNQIGTFRPADAAYLVKPLLFTQPDARAREGLGELIKMALVDGGAWAKRLLAAPDEGAELVWKFLLPAVRAKLAVVRRDPEERSGARQVLNLGHTVGHVLEAHLGLTHGRAVAQGLHFALDWSVKRAGLAASERDRFRALLERHTGEAPPAGRTDPLPRRAFLRLLGRDKKADAGGTVTFVFLKGLGQPVRRRVRREAVAAEAAQQGWI